MSIVCNGQWAVHPPMHAGTPQARCRNPRAYATLHTQGRLAWPIREHATYRPNSRRHLAQMPGTGVAFGSVASGAIVMGLSYTAQSPTVTQGQMACGSGVIVPQVVWVSRLPTQPISWVHCSQPKVVPYLAWQAWNRFR